MSDTKEINFASHKLTAMDNAALRYILDVPRELKNKLRKYMIFSISVQEFLDEVIETHPVKDHFPFTATDTFEVAYFNTNIDHMEKHVAKDARLIVSFRHAWDNNVRIALVLYPASANLQEYCKNLKKYVSYNQREL